MCVFLCVCCVCCIHMSLCLSICNAHAKRMLTNNYYFIIICLSGSSLALSFAGTLSLSLCLSAGLYVCLSVCLPVRLSVSSHDFATRLRNSVSVVVRPSACLVQSSYLSHSTLPVSFSLSACLFVCLTAFVIRIRCCICAVDYFLLIFLSLFEQIFTCNVELGLRSLSLSLYSLSFCFYIWN